MYTIRTQDRLYYLGETDDYNVSATIHKATVTGGVDGLTEVETQSANSGFVSWYKSE